MTTIDVKCVHAELSPSTIREIVRSYEQAFDRFAHMIREARLTLRDSNGPKGGVDKLCTIQLRFSPGGMAVLRSRGVSFAQAARSACEKIRHVAEKRLSKRKTLRRRRARIQAAGEAHELDKQR